MSPYSTIILSILGVCYTADAFTTSTFSTKSPTALHLFDSNTNVGGEEKAVPSRRSFLEQWVVATAGTVATLTSNGDMALSDDNRPDSLDIDNFLRTGQEAFPMGVSGQAGKSRPVTGVYLRDGSDVSRDARTGNVLAEIVLGEKANLSAVLVSFQSPWSLAKGTVFDVECRDAKTGDGAFLAVTESIPSNKGLSDLPSSFFLDQLFSATGRFSFYGPPTDIKMRKSTMIGSDKRLIEFTFSNLSQSTQAEIPRSGMLIATVPESSSNQAVMLVGSANTNRWKSKGMDVAVRQTMDSFSAVTSKSTMKVRAKMPESSIDFD